MFTPTMQRVGQIGSVGDTHVFGLLVEPFPGDDPLEHLGGPHHDSTADRLHEALKRGQPPDDLDDEL